MKKILYLILTLTFLSDLTYSQSKLIGTNKMGGNGFGTIYKYTAGDTSLSDVLKIKGSSIFQNISLVKIGNCFYGSASSGGGAGMGSLFKYNLISKTLTNIHQFSRDSGSTPNSRLLLASNGKLYGSTWQSGLFYGGTIFEFDPTTEVYTTILNCDSVSGTQITSDFIQASNGNLYITTTQNGNNGFGTILELDLNTMTVQKIYDFTTPTGTNYLTQKGIHLIESVNGILTGFWFGDGANNYGLIFEFDLNTHAFSIKYTFDGINGKFPVSVSKVTSTKIIGATNAGGLNNFGVLFEYDFVSNIYTKKFDFTGINGKNPICYMIKLTNGKFYGTTYSGGINDNGVIFEYNFTTNSFLKLFDFETENYPLPVQLATDNIGNLYGSQEWITSDYTFEYLFKFNLPTGNMVKESIFGLNDGNILPGGFILASNGKYYAATYQGGKNYCGTVIEYDYNSNTITKKLDLNDSIGCKSYSSLVYASNGKIYGTTIRGGTDDYGTLFEYDYMTNTILKKHDFSFADGTQNSPGGWLMEASNGKIYGTFQNGGLYGMGTLYEYDFVSNVFTIKANFNDTIGVEPHGKLVQATNGKLYTTLIAGSMNNGGIIEYNLTTDSIIKKFTFPANIYGSSGSLIEVAPNKLYGYFGNGIYEYNCSTNQLTNLYNFSLANGYPTGDLINASNGKLYGVTYHNSATFGGLFEFDLATGDYSQKINWNQLENGWKPGDHLLEVGCIAPGILASGPVSFCQGDSVVLTAFGSNSNFFQWNRNGTAISGANSQNFTVKNPGKYSVTVTDTLCSLPFTSNFVRVRIPCILPNGNQNKIAEGFNEDEINIHYNSNDQQIELYANDIQSNFYRIIVVDATGKILINENASIFGNTISRKFNCFGFAKGLYVINMIYGDKKISLKFVKEE